MAAEANIHDIAAGWLMRMLAAPLPAGDAARLQRWLHADPRHAEALDAARAAWALAGDLGDAPAMAAERRRALTFRVADGAPTSARASAAASAATSRPWRAVAAAAAVAGLLFTAQPPPAQAFETQRGQSLRAVLADGSVIALNTDSRIVVRYGWVTNTVVVERGEAEITPATGLHRPLRVRVNAIEVRATAGVAIRDYGDGAAVLALGAPVEVRAPGAVPVQLAAAQRGLVAPGRPLQIASVDTARALAWRHGQLIFDSTSLAAAFAEFGRYGGAEVTIAPDIAGLTVSGAYRTGDMRTFLDALPAIHPVRWRQVAPGRVRIERASAS